MEEESLNESDAVVISEVSVVNRYVICERCKLLIPDTDNVSEHICEAAAVVSDADAEMIVESSVKGYQCDYCHKTFAQASNLKRHERIHTGERPFVCFTCNRSFAQCSNLKAHVRLHTGERPYVCTLCDRSFTQSGNLYKHVRTHDPTVDDRTRRPFVCLVCGRGFANNSMLTMHLRTHSGERPFKCELCGRSFTQESNLRRHTRTHTGERPFVCGVCERSFTQSNNLKAHMTLHCSRVDAADGGRVTTTSRTVVMWPCDLCDAQFTRRTKLERHRLSHSAPRIIVVTPSGLRLTAQQVTMHHNSADDDTPVDARDPPDDTGDPPVSAAVSDSADPGPVHVNSLDD